MKNNAYFDEMYRIGCEWSKQSEAHKARKEEIIEKYGWESDELKAWYAEEEQLKFPFSGGANKAFRAWRYTEGDEILFDDHCWDSEIHDFIDALRSAGFKTLLLVLGHGDGQRQERRGIRRSGRYPGGGSAGFHAALFFGNGGDQLQAIPDHPGRAHIRHNQY